MKQPTFHIEQAISKNCDQNFSFLQDPDFINPAKGKSIEEGVNSIKLNLTPEQEFIYNLIEEDKHPTNKLLDKFMEAFQYSANQYKEAHSKVALIIENLRRRKLIIGDRFSGDNKLIFVQTKLF